MELGLTLDPFQRYVWHRLDGVTVLVCDTVCLGICPGDM